MGKHFVFLLPCSRAQPCCLLHTCDNSGLFALLTSNILILDGLDEQEAGEAQPTRARKFFARSDQPSSCLPLLSFCTPPDPVSLPHTFRWETQGGGRHKLTMPGRVLYLLLPAGVRCRSFFTTINTPGLFSSTYKTRKMGDGN